MRSKSTLWIRKIRNENLRKFGYKCFDCGRKGTDFHHVEVTPLFGHDRGGSYYRAMDVRKNPDAYVLLCKKCHKKRHLKEGY